MKPEAMVTEKPLHGVRTHNADQEECQDRGKDPQLDKDRPETFPQPEPSLRVVAIFRHCRGSLAFDFDGAPKYTSAAHGHADSETHSVSSEPGTNSWELACECGAITNQKVAIPILS